MLAPFRPVLCVAMRMGVLNHRGVSFGFGVLCHVFGGAHVSLT